MPSSPGRTSEVLKHFQAEEAGCAIYVPRNTRKAAKSSAHELNRARQSPP